MNRPQIDHKLTTDHDHVVTEVVCAVPPPKEGTTDHDHLTTPPPPRLTNFETAAWASMCALRAVDQEIEALDGLGSASVVSGRQSVEVVDAKLVPVRFQKVEINTVAAGSALRAGAEIPGLRLGKFSKASLRVVGAK